MQSILHSLITTACCAALAQPAAAAEAAPQHSWPAAYRVRILSTADENNSRGNSINNLGLVAGYSRLTGSTVRHATVWAFGHRFDLGSLGGPGYNSSVPWPVKNLRGAISGISETGQANPLGETWSCGFFFGTSGNICLGFVSEWGRMRALNPLSGGYNSFATGTNNRGQTAGWAENGVHDSTCAPDSDQILQFRPVVWGPGRNQIRELPLIGGDTSGSATALNDHDQVVGISGTCDQAVGRRTAAHAVLWDHGMVVDIGNLGAQLWNTPMAVNQRGDIVGFGGTVPDDLDGNFTHAFLKPRNGTIRDLGTLGGDISSTATGINERGQVVGYSNDEAGTFRAFVWLDGTMVDLKSLAPDFAGNLVLANDINDFGQITGRASDPATGAPVAFIATPVYGHGPDDGAAADEDDTGNAPETVPIRPR